MQAAHADEHEQLVSHVSPGHALSVRQPPFFLSRDAVNFAALDYLIGLTGKVSTVRELGCSWWNRFVFTTAVTPAHKAIIRGSAFC